jgi:hypothetical protein
MELENKVEITVYREMIKQQLTDEEWEALASHIEGSIDQFIEDSTEYWLQELPSIVEEERKYY